jgi:hypothetical protein
MSYKLRVTSYKTPGVAGRSPLEKQPTDPAYDHARQLKEPTRGKDKWTEVFVPTELCSFPWGTGISAP